MTTLSDSEKIAVLKKHGWSDDLIAAFFDADLVSDISFVETEHEAAFSAVLDTSAAELTLSSAPLASGSS